MSVAAVVDVISAAIAPVWIEVCFLVCFYLGWLVLRFDLLATRIKRPKGKKLEDDPPSKKEAVFSELARAVEAEQPPSSILAAWRSECILAPTPPDMLKPVAEAFCEVAPSNLVRELTNHIKRHRDSLANNRTAVIILNVVARAGNIEVMEDLVDTLRKELNIRRTLTIFEVLLGGYATAGLEHQVHEVLADLSTSGRKPTARGLSLTIKGFLKNGMLDAVMDQLKEMNKLGYKVPPFAINQAFRLARDASRLPAVFDQTVKLFAIPPDAITTLMEECVRSSNLQLSKRFEDAARQACTELSVATFEALLKVYAAAADGRAADLFREMQAKGLKISEGLCVGLLSRCADAKSLKFAEEIFQYVRERGEVSVATYSAFMKVYAYAGLYDRACDLFDELIKDGLEPDATMYGCLMKFSVQCGRTDLSRRLAESTPSLEIQNYMCLIRAAVRDRDVETAFKALGQLKAKGNPVDSVAYNCVLDACVSAGDLDRAMSLVEEMKSVQILDVVTYNTLLKGYCAIGDVKRAKEIMRQMEAEGFKPNGVSYNCLLHAATQHGGRGFQEVWNVIDTMVKKKIKVDNYTLCILLKAFQHPKDREDVTRALALVDKCGIQVCSDEIVLNAYLESCIKFGETKRIEGLLSQNGSSISCPSLHTYGKLIKACSVLGRLPQCWRYWQEMTVDRGMVPSEIVLGCMLDALVSNLALDDAVDLLAKYKDIVQPNKIMYSTILKGCASMRKPRQAMLLWEEMRKDGIECNVVVYNAIIDSQARVGNMDSVKKLVADMESDGVAFDAITHSTVIKCSCITGDLDKAMQQLDAMKQAKLANDAIVYNTIMTGCTKWNRLDLAAAVFEDMQRSNIPASNFTLVILVKLYGKQHQLKKAFDAVEQLPKKYHFRPSKQVLTCLVMACLNCCDLDLALTVFDNLRKLPEGADSKAYAAIVFGCVRLGDSAKGIELVQQAYAEGAKWQVCCFEDKDLEALVMKLRDKDQAEVAVCLLNRLHSQKVPVPSRVYAIALGSKQD